MSKVKITAIAALMATAACPALALDFGNGFTVGGDVELEYTTSNSFGDGLYGFGNTTLGWRSQGGGTVGLGFDLALVNVAVFNDAVDSNEYVFYGNSYKEFWGGLVLTTSFGEVTIGNPRSLLKTMIDSPEVGGIRVYDAALSMVNGPWIEQVPMDTGSEIYGVSFKGVAGALNYGVSYHTVDFSDSNDADVLELAANYQLGKTLLQVGAQQLKTSFQGDFNGKMLILGATHAEDRWSAGALLTTINLDVNASGFYTNSVKIFGKYSITDAFDVGAQVLRLEYGNDEHTSYLSNTNYGINGEYRFASGAFAQLGVVNSEGEAGRDTTYSASVGYRF